jgi:hypothetical protein
LYKPSDTTGFVGDDDPPREVAASRLAEALKWGDLVPTVTTWNGPKGPGSAAQFLNEEMAGPGKKDIAEYNDDQRQRAAIFDYVTGNTDRHGDNYMTKEPLGDLVLIDHGNAFMEVEPRGIRSPFTTQYKGKPLNPDLISELQAVDPSKVQSVLRSAGLSEPVVQAAVERFKEVQERGMITGENWDKGIGL